MWLDYADDVAECKVTCRFSCNRVTIQENDTHCDTHVSRLITPVLQVLPALDRLTEGDAKTCMGWAQPR